MAYIGWKDITGFTFNSVDLKAWLSGVDGLAQHATKQEFRPAGSTWATNLDTGERTQDDIVAHFIADGAAGGPNITCAMGTSATLTVTLATGQTVSGTFWVSDVAILPQSGQDDMLDVTLTPTDTITWDLTA